MPNGQPKQLANLRPPWTSETAPRGRGRRKGFVSTSEFQKSLSETSIEELERISNDDGEPANKRFAAFQLLVMAGKEKGVRLAERLAYAEAFADRTEGKAVQRQEIDASVGEHRPIVIDQRKWDALGSETQHQLPTEVSNNDQGENAVEGSKDEGRSD